MRYYLPVKLETIWEPVSAIGRNNTEVSQEIQYQTTALFTTYSWDGASVSFINWWAGSSELPAQAKFAVVCEHGGVSPDHNYPSLMTKCY